MIFVLYTHQSPGEGGDKMKIAKFAYISSHEKFFLSTILKEIIFWKFQDIPG